jgi:hypothetical protein
MSHAMPTARGAMVSLWRYSVKSMLGEELNTTQVSVLSPSPPHIAFGCGIDGTPQEASQWSPRVSPGCTSV